jgi:Ecdysteroid kinase-like family
MNDNDVRRIVQQCIPKIVLVPVVGHVEENDIGTVSSNNVIETVQDVSDMQVETVCSLWAGMGHIYNITLTTDTFNRQQNCGTCAVQNTKRDKSNSTMPSSNMPKVTQIIIKHIVLPNNLSQESLSNRRKTDSYYVEANFYEKLAPIVLSQHNVTVPIPYVIERPLDESSRMMNGPSTQRRNEIIIAMSYVETNRVRHGNRHQQRDAVLTWLANFHSIFWGHEQADYAVRVYGLQAEGTYWYLNTRPDEHDAMSNTGWIGRLKLAARAIADYLQHRDPYQCILHGDAKDANILYTTHTNTERNHSVGCTATFCDFQYCGKGSFTKDLIYFLMRFDDKDDDNMDDAINFYLTELSKRLSPSNPVPTLDELQISLSLVNCDLYRFMIGWGSWGSNNRPNKRVVQVLDRLDNGNKLNSEEAYDQALRREFG